MKEIKTGDMYKKLQKELDKGNAVLVEVEFGYSDIIRYRLVTPKNCEYADDCKDNLFRKSCFVGRKKNIVKHMQVYDKEYLSIKRMLVL